MKRLRVWWDRMTGERKFYAYRPGAIRAFPMTYREARNYVKVVTSGPHPLPKGSIMIEHESDV